MSSVVSSVSRHALSNDDYRQRATWQHSVGRTTGSVFFSAFFCALCCLAPLATLFNPRSAGAQPPAKSQTAGGADTSRGTSGDTFKVASVEVVGNRHVDTSAIRVQLKQTAGAISREQISEDIKTLYNSGFFDQVSASLINLGPKTVLRYTVTEKPLVRKVFLKGNKEIKEADLSDILQLSGKRFIDRSRIDYLTKQATSYYQSQGFYDASFEHSIVPVGDNQIDLTFTVTEGKRVRIRKVELRGLKQLDESDVKSVLQTKRYKWWNSWLYGTGRLNQEMLQNDRNLMRQYLLDHGFVDGSVGDPIIEKRAGSLYLSFDIEEGQLYKIGRVNASGDLVSGKEEKTLEGIKIKPGEIFNASAIRDDAFTISEKFTDSGFAFANVVPSTNVRRNDATVDIDFSSTKGKLVSVNRINVKGNTKTYDNVIRREIKLVEQDTFSSSKVRRSQELLQRLGYFEEVNISTEPTERDDQVDLNVNIREGSTGAFSAGAGFSSSDGALFNARLSEDNLFGTGRRAVLNVDLGTERDNYVLSYSDDRLNDTHVSWGVELLRTQREFSDFDRSLTGASTQLGYPLEEVFGEKFEDVSASIKYEFLVIDIDNLDQESAAPLVLSSEGTSSSSAITPRITRNTINNPLNPTKGSRQILSAELAGLGAQERFYLLEAKNQWYYPIIPETWSDLVFSIRTSFAYGKSYNGDPFPLFRRFIPGGINTVRGYRNRSLGPKDSAGDEYGGDKELINNAEVIFPLVSSAGLKGVIFYDVGQAFDDNRTIEISKLRRAYGAGIRWTSPLGPIRIEFGFPVSREEGEDKMVTLFSFGSPL